MDEAKLNFVLAVVKGVKPRDQLEAMLATQMAAVHLATMTLARRLAEVGGAPSSAPERDSLSSAFNKCARTFASQLEALKRHRAGGEQKVTMQHVSVNEGGQAIVGNVSQGARAESPANSPPALGHSRRPAMTIIGEQQPAPAESAAWGKKMTDDPPPNTSAMLSSRRCGAKTRSGAPCRAPAARGKKRCRMHGGAPGTGAPRGNKNARTHGRYTREAIEERRRLQALLRQSRELTQQIE